MNFVRPVTVLALIQTGVVVMGFLFVCVGVKAGFWRWEDNLSAARLPYLVHFLRFDGLILLAIPVLWTGMGLWLEPCRTTGEIAFLGWGVMVFLCLVFVLGFALGIRGPLTPFL